MNYSKPEIDVLGDATRVIDIVQGKPGGSIDAQTQSTGLTGPAYDLDE